MGALKREEGEKVEMSIARMLRVQGKTERLGTQYKDKLQGRECMFMRVYVPKNLCEYVRVGLCMCVVESE